MDACSSRSSEIVDQGKALEGLLDAFVSTFSIEEITSAYYKAGRNVDSAAEILSGCQDDKSSNASWMSDIGTSAWKSECSLASSQELPWEKSFDTVASKGEHCGARSQEPLPNNSLDRHTHFNKHSRPRQRKNSYSIGTVSSFLGKGYAKSYPSTNGVNKVTKHMRSEVKEDDLGEDVSVSSTAPRSEPMRKKDVEEFLFSLLGEGFLLGKDVIQEVLSQCGYDAKKTINRLEYLAMAPFGERDVAPGDATEKPISAMDNRDALLNNVACSSKESQASQKKLQNKDFSHSEGAIERNGAESFCMDKDKHNLSRELLESLFAVRETCDNIPRKNRPVRAVKKKAIGRPVTSPLSDHDEERSPAIIGLQDPEVDSEDEEDEYQLLRQAAKKNWNAKWEYCEAALEAFLKGDHAKANYLMEQANGYHEKAREADEKSARVILETSKKKGAQDLITIDVHEYHAKDAKKQLKCLLRSLSGIDSVRLLKVILETSNEDITKSTRKRMVLKLLQKESIKWTEEEGSPGTILIRLDEINPQNLSFA